MGQWDGTLLPKIHGHASKKCFQEQAKMFSDAAAQLTGFIISVPAVERWDSLSTTPCCWDGNNDSFWFSVCTVASLSWIDISGKPKGGKKAFLYLSRVNIAVANIQVSYRTLRVFHNITQPDSQAIKIHDDYDHADRCGMWDAERLQGARR